MARIGIPATRAVEIGSLVATYSRRWLEDKNEQWFLGTHIAPYDIQCDIDATAECLCSDECDHGPFTQTVAILRFGRFMKIRLTMNLEGGDGLERCHWKVSSLEIVQPFRGNSWEFDAPHGVNLYYTDEYEGEALYYLIVNCCGLPETFLAHNVAPCAPTQSQDARAIRREISYRQPDGSTQVAHYSTVALPPPSPKMEEVLRLLCDGGPSDYEDDL